MHNVEILSPSDHPELLTLCLLSYQFEARLLQCENFPPLRETVEDLDGCLNEVRAGIREQGQLIAAIGMEPEVVPVLISRLVIHPDWFRRGLGRKLVQWLQEQYPALRVVTGLRNEPAIRLYQSCGFKPDREFELEGIQLLELNWACVPRDASGAD